LDQTDDLGDIVRCILALSDANENFWKELWRNMNKEILGERLSCPEDIWMGASYIENIFSLDDEIAYELCKMLNLPRLASLLSKQDNLEYQEKYLEVIGETNNNVQKKLKSLLSSQN